MGGGGLPPPGSPQTALARDKFFTTVGQALYASEITRPRYLKEVTISRGHP